MMSWLLDDEKIPERIHKIDSIYIDTQINFRKVKNTNSSQYCTILNLLSLNQAQDFFNGRPLGTYMSAEINDHHIFPVKSKRIMDEDLRDSILNRTLIHVDTNNKIKSKKPSEYYQDIMASHNGDAVRVKSILKSHFISEKALIYIQNDDFERFIHERENTIKNVLKTNLGLISKKRQSGFKPDNE